MKKILCVDDEKYIQGIIEEVLNEEGNYQIDKAENGLDGFLLAQKNKYEIILTDFQMPIMTGGSLAQSLRKKENPNQGTPIIIISAFLDPAKRVTKDLEGIHFLGKPINLEGLVGLVKETMPT